MEVLHDLLTLPSTSPRAFQEFTSSISEIPIVAVAPASPPPRKIARLNTDSDITSTSRPKPAQGPIHLVINGRSRPFATSDPSKEYILVRRAIQEVLSPGVVPSWSYAEVFDACHHAVCVEHKGEGLHNAARSELRACTEKMAKDIVAASSEGLTPIQLVVDKCAWFETQVALLSSLLTFLDQNYSPPHEHIKELAYTLFSQKILESLEVASRLHNSLKLTLTSERDSLKPSSVPSTPPSSETRTLLATFMKQLVTHGHYDSFEDSWVQVTHEYFEQESKTCADSLEPQPFFEHLQKRIEQEEQRMKSVMPAMSWNKVGQVVVGALLDDRLEWLSDGVVSIYMSNKDLPSLESLYRLFVSVGGTKILCAAFKADVATRATQIIKDTSSEETIVQRLLDLKQLCDDAVAKVFVDPNPPTLSTTSSSAESTTPKTTYIPNLDFSYAITDAFSLGFKARRNKPAELIAKYINMRMRKGAGGDEAKFNKEMDRVLEMHRFTDDKDVFRVFYQRMLAKRLLLERSASDDDERRMLKRLTTDYDPEFGSGEQMFKDLAVSRTLMDQFMKDRGKSADVEGFSAVVLQQSHWPISPSKIKPLLPISMQTQLDTYTTFYKKQHKGRSLSWNHGYGTATLFGRFDEKPKELTMSMFQALVLLLFNDGDHLTYTFIGDNTGIPEEELKPVLQSLALGKKRVLKKMTGGKDVVEGDMFKFNAGFTDPRPKVHINSIQVKETVAEQQRTESSILEDRKHYLDAAIVRIMKAKKELTYNRLVEETIQAVNKHFIPQPSDIKKRVESLVEQEYMERKEGVQGVYTYVA